MLPDRLFELALAFKKTRLWKRLYDTELFAFARSDGEVCYCCVTGHNGQHLALSVYSGARGLDTYRAVLSAGEDLSPAQRQELFLSMECVQCSFEGEDDTFQDQLEQCRDYARRTGVSLSGKNPYPCFVTCRRHMVPAPMEREEEIELLCQGLTAALDLNTLLSQSSKEALGLRVCFPCEGPVPLVRSNGFGGAEVTPVELPAPLPPVYLTPVFQNELAPKRLSRLKRKGTWQCALILNHAPVEDPEGGVPFFPSFILFWDSVSEMLSVTNAVRDGPEQGALLLEGFCKAMSHEKRVPAIIEVRDDATSLLLEDLARKLGISMVRRDELEMLEDFEEELFGEEETADEEVDELAVLLHMLSEMPPEMIAQMPADLREQLMQLNAEELLPPDLSSLLSNILAPKPQKRPAAGGETPPRGGKSKGRGKGRKFTNQSLVISVSLGTGCYRHIRISADATLRDLSDAILATFGFYNDHMHMFCMDNQTWNSRDAYYSDTRELREPASRGTGKVKLGQLALEQGHRFRYVFDFGEEWNFQCRVLRLLEEGTDEPTVVRSKGVAPEQYPD